jgi:proteic killer suppression protein
VIKSFHHAGLEKFFSSGSKSGIQPGDAKKLSIRLGRLNVAETPSDMNVAGWQFHELSGNLKGHFSIRVNGNWRMTFCFEGEDAILVDYQDYH